MLNACIFKLVHILYRMLKMEWNLNIFQYIMVVLSENAFIASLSIFNVILIVCLYEVT